MVRNPLPEIVFAETQPTSLDYSSDGTEVCAYLQPLEELTCPSDMSKADILIVDDIPDNLRLLSTILTERGYEVRKSLNGRMALKTMQAALPDLILLDITMPDMNGYEVCERLKADSRMSAVPVIFISALDDVLDKVKAFSVGGVDYITKPFQGEEVLARVENQLRLRALQTKLVEQNTLLKREIEQREQTEIALRQSEMRERDKAVQLERALEELKHTQTELIQTEKMSGLGRMVAGIAHEINNPISFIHGNVDYAENYVRDLLRLIDLYQQTYPCPSETIQQLIDEIDLDFVMEDLKRLLTSMRMGSERISQIVLSLRIFSRLERSDIKPTDLHEGIETTLMILRHRLAAVGNRVEIEVVKQYGNLPKVTCHAGQLNQVFMNILSNAIDALEERANNAGKFPDPPRISIETELIQRQANASSEIDCLAETDRVTIRIADNGLGVSEDERAHVFDPFFTTKPVGRGTGLGLAICYQIVVERHAGHLTCQSLPEGGTEFIIELPVQSR